MPATLTKTEIEQLNAERIAKVEAIREATPQDLRKYLPDNMAIDADGQFFELTKTRAKNATLSTLTATLSPDHKQQFAHNYLAHWPLVPRFAKGGDIHEVFERYRPGSCMRFAKCEGLRVVYENNPDKVMVAYMLKSDHTFLESHWSCLVWIGSSYHVDNIYSNGFPSITGFRCHLWHAIADNLPDKPTKIISASTDRLQKSKNLVFELDHDCSEPLPYMDSLYVIRNYTSDTVTLATSGDGDHATNVNGTCPDGSTSQSCCNCGESVSEDCSYHHDGETYCEDCFHEHFSMCEHCEEHRSCDYVQYLNIYNRRWRSEGREYASICDDCLQHDFIQCDSGEYCYDTLVIDTVEGGQYAPDETDDLIILDVGENAGEYTHYDHAVSDINDEWVHIDDCHELHDGGYACHDDCVELHDGQYALSEHCHELHNGDYALEDDCVELHDGQYALEDDCVELHNGDYALESQAIELHDGQYGLPASVEPYSPNFIIPSETVEIPITGSSVEGPLRAIKGLPMAYDAKGKLYHAGNQLWFAETDKPVEFAKTIWSIANESQKQLFNEGNGDKLAYWLKPLVRDVHAILSV